MATKAKKKKTATKAELENYKHGEAKRKNIPTAENQKLVADEDKAIKKLRWPRNPDLDPQLVWRGKDFEADPLEVDAPPIYIQEKIQPRAIVEALRKQSKERAKGAAPQFEFFHDFNGLPEGWKEDATASYYHDEGNWQNRMILGDSLLVMASLAEREGLRGKVKCVYFDPPYGVRFNSNWQPTTKSREVSNTGNQSVSREPEVIRAFRDTWREGKNSYLTYLRDRLTAAHELLHETGSLFLQIGDENLHIVRSVIAEVFGPDNYLTTIVVKKKGSTVITEPVNDYLVWFCKSRQHFRVRRVFDMRRQPDEDTKFNTLISRGGEMKRIRSLGSEEIEKLLQEGWRWARVNFPIVSQDFDEKRSRDYEFNGALKKCGTNRHWSYDVPSALDRLARADRLYDAGGSSLGGVVYWADWPYMAISNLWDDVKGEEDPIYVVQTAWRIIERCLLLATEPGDLVLDPTCGSGTTAYVAEQWGRRWITIDTSRVALTLARARLMGAKYDYYHLKDSKEGAEKEG
jgi:adenine-specific DNA-methyltransferase